MPEDNQPKPKPQPAGSATPPRPPRGTVAASATGGDGSDDPHKLKPRKETVRITLPPKPTTPPKITR